MKINMYRCLYVGIALVSIAGVSPVMATGVECSPPGGPVEKTICTDPALLKLDNALGALYDEAVLKDPQVNQRQLYWVQNSLSKCDTKACLVSAYQTQLLALKAQLSGGSAGASANPVATLIDVKSFLGSYRESESFWKDPNETLFGKRVSEWNDQDFQLLTQKFREQVAIERAVAVETARRVGSGALPEDNGIYQDLKRAYERYIELVPKFQYWANLGREQARQQTLAAEAQQVAKENQRKAEEARRQAVEAQYQAERQQEQERRDRQRNLWIVAIVAVLAAGGWFWNKFIRNRCPDCKSSSYATISKEELDRWRGTKQVSEKHSRGTNTRHVQTTYVMMHYAFRCKACQNEWTKDRQEELGAHSIFDKFLSGF